MHRTTLPFLAGAIIVAVFSTMLVATAGQATAQPALHSGSISNASSTASTSESVTALARRAGPPKGLTTTKMQRWIEDWIKGTSSCNPNSSFYPCKITFDWSRVRWLGTTRVCVKGVLGKPCLEWGTAHVARTDLLITETTQELDTWTNEVIQTTVSKDQRGYWNNGRKRVSYQPWPGGPTWKAGCRLDCGKDLYIRRGKFGRWNFGWGNTSYILR